MHVCFQAIVRFLREKKHLIPIHMVKTMSYEVSHLGFQIEKKPQHKPFRGQYNLYSYQATIPSPMWFQRRRFLKF